MMSKEEGETDIHGTEKEYPLGGREGVRPNSDESNPVQELGSIRLESSKESSGRGRGG